MIKKTLMAAVLLATLIGAQAQEKTLRLSLKEAQEYALSHNYSLQNASLDVQKAEAARWETLSTMLPQVSAGFDYSNMCGYTMSMSGFSIPMNPYGTFSVSASIALTGQQIVGTMMQKLAVEMSDITKQKTELTTLTGVKNVYVSILVMEDIVGLLDSSLANVIKLEESTRASVEVGAAEQISADKLSVQVASLRNSINSNKRSLALLYNSLILQLGADVDAEIVLTTKLDDIFNIEKIAQLTMNGFDITNNYDYQLLQKNEELSHKQVVNAWMNYTPTLSAYYQYSAKTYFGKDEGFNMTPPNVVGASLSLPLFKSWNRVAAVKEANIAYQETVYSKQQAEDGLKVQYKQLAYDLASAIESYTIQKENLNVTKRVFKNTSEKYQYGRASNLEVTNASTDLITAESNYVQAVMSVIQAQLSLESLLGRTE